LTSWSHASNPCFVCCAAGGQEGAWRRHDGISPISLPWPLRSTASYEAACARCERVVRVVSALRLREIVALLEFDKRSRGGSFGRRLVRDLPSLGLKAGWRLEPSRAVPNVGAVDGMCDAFPEGGVELTFWITAEETFVRHRNPLLTSTSLNITNLVVDELHTLHLRIFQNYILFVAWACLRSNVFELHAENKDALIAKGILRLRGDLWEWYKVQKRTNPSRPLYELTDFTKATIGSDMNGPLRAKAAESGTLLFFVRSWLDDSLAYLRKVGSCSPVAKPSPSTCASLENLAGACLWACGRTLSTAVCAFCLCEVMSGSHGGLKCICLYIWYTMLVALGIRGFWELGSTRVSTRSSRQFADLRTPLSGRGA